MDTRKKKRLEAAGWKTGNAADFLGLEPADSAFIAMKMSLGSKVRELRQAGGLTQLALARQIQSSQSRIAKMEAGDPGVSMDLLIRTVLALGASQDQIARFLKSRKTS